MPEAQDANERFDRLWDEIGAAQIVVGDEDKGVEIVVDADLSIFGVLEKLKDAARTDHGEDKVSDDERKMIASALEDYVRTLSGGVQDRLRRQIGKFTGKDR